MPPEVIGAMFDFKNTKQLREVRAEMRFMIFMSSCC